MSELTVLTLNIWGLWLVSQKREQRVRYLADYLRTCKEDVVLLQEVWVDADAQLLMRAGKAGGLLHCTHFRSGRFGSGLVTLSRYPIIRHGFWRYAAAGFATAIHCGDYYTGKGVGWVRLATPQGEIDVFNTHLHANYCHDYRVAAATLCKSAAAATTAITGGSAEEAAAAAAAAASEEQATNADGDNTAAEPSGASASRRLLQAPPAWQGSRIPDDDDAGTRISQVMELSELVDLISTGGGAGNSGGGSSDGGGGSSRVVVLAGDLNCEPDTVEMDLLRMRLPQLRDAWVAAAERSCGGGDGSGAAPGTAAASDSAPNPSGFTCHAPGNSYQPRRQVPERIDYIWSNLSCRRAEVTLQSVPSGSFSYSDHFAVRAVLTQKGPAAATSPAGSKLGGMKLGGVFRKAAAGAAGGAGQVAGVQGGEGGEMAVGRKVATALGAAMLLEEGIRSFSADSGVMTALAGFCLMSVAYTAIALPLCMPEVAFRGIWFTLALLLAGAVAAAGMALLVIGVISSRSQKRALQGSYRQLRVWMEQQLGLEGTGPSADGGADSGSHAVQG